jgi:hypothetical protein
MFCPDPEPDTATSRRMRWAPLFSAFSAGMSGFCAFVLQHDGAPGSLIAMNIAFCAANVALAIVQQRKG